MAADFVGSKECKSCHQGQFEDWQGSHHDMSMRHADSNSVLGDFNNVSFDFSGKTNKFFIRDSNYWVYIEGPDGKFHHYQIKYTFGFNPLQQYMVEFEDGRVQLIPFAWDSRSKQEGGQRWFYLYPEFTDNHDEFFWTNTGQNWNYMCADCHSTNVRKNYDLKSNTYSTQFSEVNVGCEACHGPASDHLAWTKASNAKIESYGFNRDLSKSVDKWVVQDDFNTLKPKNIDHSEQVLVCAQCHSRRTQLGGGDHVKAKAFGERYLLDLIDEEHYYADGQVYDEDFVYGSFLQSKMHDNGVVCSNCHNPHSAELTLPKETLCLQCHQTDKYAVKSHHQHQNNSTGSQCINCHMPETTYMQIDARRDHGWHTPRPDLARQLGTPDTCLTCHKGKDSDWSNKYLVKWYSQSTVREEKDFASSFTAATQGLRGAVSELSRISQTVTYSNIIRASALQRMSGSNDPNAIVAIARGAKSSDDNIKLGAIDGAVNLNAAERWRIISPLLNDPVLAVRTEAASTLASLWPSLTPQQQVLLNPALQEYMEVQTYNADRGFSHVNKAIVYSYQGKAEQAIVSYRQSIEIEPYFSPAYVNLAELFRQLQRDNEAVATLKLGMAKNPENGDIPFSLGLAYIRSKESAKAISYLKLAAELAVSNAHYYYVYGLSLEASNRAQAYKALYGAYNISRNPQHLYALCDMQVRYQAKEAEQCINELSRVAPADVVSALRLKWSK